MIETDAAYAKVNLSLDIISKMPDGYHSLQTVMQSISLCDEITVECVPGTGISADCGLPYLPGDERNIAVKAAMAFYKHIGIEGYRTRIMIKKMIPVCAGLGGGSTDGACVIRLLNKILNTGLKPEALELIGRGVGSDVPFCIGGGTKLGEGRGDVLTVLTPLPQCHAVVCKPSFSCSTVELYGRVRCNKIRARPDTAGIVEALGAGDLKGVARRMYNVFEDVLPRGERDISDIKYAMHDCGALGASMTGSGPTVIGLFDDENNAQKAYDRLLRNYEECYLTVTNAG